MLSACGPSDRCKLCRGKGSLRVFRAHKEHHREKRDHDKVEHAAEAVPVVSAFETVDKPVKKRKWPTEPTEQLMQDVHDGAGDQC